MSFALSPKSDQSSQIIQILEEFSGYNIIEMLNGDRINRLGNVITLTPTMHALFGALEIWFEEVPVSRVTSLLYEPLN